MSIKKNKSTKGVSTGIRYSDAQKKEIVDFVGQYNAQNGRGGQNAASIKYKVTPLTISGWLKSFGVKTPKAKKAGAVAANKPAKKAAKKGDRGVRYSPEEKKSVIDFVEAYNAKNGRGGQNQAAKKYKVSVLTVSAWLKAAGSKKPATKKTNASVTKAAKAVKASKGSGDLAAFKAALIKVINQF
jgi:transposase-like protein